MSSPITSQGQLTQQPSIIYQPVSRSSQSRIDHLTRVGEAFSLKDGQCLGEVSFICSSSESQNLQLRDALGICYLGESLSGYIETREQALQVSQICYGSQVMGLCHVEDFSNVRSPLGSIVVQSLLTTWDCFFDQNPDKFLLQCFVGDACFPINQALQRTPHRDKIVLVGIDSSAPVVHSNQHLFCSLSQTKKQQITAQYQRLFSSPTSDPAFSPILLNAFYDALLRSPQAVLYAAESRGATVCSKIEKFEHTYKPVTSNIEALEYLYLASNVGLSALRIVDYAHLLIKESPISATSAQYLLNSISSTVQSFSPMIMVENSTVTVDALNATSSLATSATSWYPSSLIASRSTELSTTTLGLVSKSSIPTILNTSKLTSLVSERGLGRTYQTISPSLSSVTTNSTAGSFTTLFFNISSFANTISTGQHLSQEVPSSFSSVVSEMTTKTYPTSVTSWSQTSNNWTTLIPESHRHLTAISSLEAEDADYRHALTLAAFWASQGILHGCLLGMKSHGVKSGSEGLAVVLAGGLLLGGLVDYVTNLQAIIENGNPDFATTAIRVTLVAYGTLSLVNETIWFATPCLKNLVIRAINKSRQRKGWEKFETASLSSLTQSYRSLSRRIRTIGTSLYTSGLLSVGGVSTIVTLSTDSLSFTDGTESVLLFAKSLVILMLFLSFLRAFGK